MPLRAVISDLDGTILETEDYHRRAYNALFEELGLSQHWTKEDYGDRLAKVGGEKFREIFRWLDRPQEEFVETKTRLYARKTELYVELIAADLDNGHLGLRPGVRRLFSELAVENISLAVASTCVKWAAIEVIRVALGESFLASLETICAGDDVDRMKPHPDVYLLAARKCRVAPEHCVVLEDTTHGVEAARRAGMACLATPSELARQDDFSHADLVAIDLETPEPVGTAMLRSLVP